MSKQKSIQNRSKDVNPRQTMVSKVQQYDIQVAKDLIAFYKTPLIKAVNILNKKYKLSYQKIADEVFLGELSRQAVEQQYTPKKGEDKDV